MFKVDEGVIDYCQPFQYIGGEDAPCRWSPESFNTSNSMNFDPDQCQNILYDSPMESTFVTDLNLICSDQFLVALVGSIYMSGLFFGSFIFGTLGDKIGRKLTLMVAILVASGGNLAGAFCQNYAAYCVTRFITAVGMHDFILMRKS